MYNRVRSTSIITVFGPVAGLERRNKHTFFSQVAFVEH